MNLRVILLLSTVVAAGRASAADAKAPAAAATPAAAPAVRATTPAAGAVAGAAPGVASTVTPTAAFDTFRLITDRNIFNPNRTGRRERTFEEAPPRIDVVSLVGTMEADKVPRAFFDSSEAAFRKAVHVGDTIDKFKIAQIAPAAVELERDGKTFSLRVGQQLRRPEGADWNIADMPSRSPVTLATPARVDPNAPPVIPADADEVTRRLMERRAQQLKQ
jgi:hypothetical protein